MHLPQRGKVPTPSPRKALAIKPFLVLICLLLCSTVLPLFTATAHAASVGSRDSGSVHVKPATSGGGCASAVAIRGCISENSEGYVVPDAYILITWTCNVHIKLFQWTGLYWNQVNDDDLSGRCYYKNTHLTGFSVPAVPGRWYTSATGYIDGSNTLYVANSLTLYTTD